MDVEMGGEIFKVLPIIAAKVGGISKDRTNTQQGYKFRGIDDLYDALHMLLAEHGVTVIPEVLDVKREERPSKSGGVLLTTLATIRYTFYARDGSNVSAVTIGEGMDSGDKASYKAMAGAHKYALVQTFTVPTREDADADNENPEPITQVEKLRAEIMADLVNSFKLGTLDKNTCTGFKVEANGADSSDALQALHKRIRVAIVTKKEAASA